MDGILNINKPAGMTSFRVVARVKRLTGEKHAGHAGTLDPDATGVLPVFLGKATRVVEFLMDDKKTYRAVIELGKATDTYDGSGKVLLQRDAKDIKRKQVEEALKSFRGEIDQVPPMYSALKHQGQPLYRLARAGVNVERKSRRVNIYQLEILKYDSPLVELDIECSKGTYIRSLANDLGEKLGCGAYLKSLARTQYGIFSVEDAITLDGLEEAVNKGGWEKHLYPTDAVLQGMESITVDEAGEAAIRTGSLLNSGETEYNGQGEGQKYLRAYGEGERFLGILVRDKESGPWRPKKVFV